MTPPHRLWRRARLAYQLGCAREDAKVRNIITPIGVWVCEHCLHVSLTQLTFRTHLAASHA
jgi:hypothetical protein